MQQELAMLILAVVAQIPHGRVASYGQVARLAGLPQHARLVGRVLQQLDAQSDVPWHRVVNVKGEIRTQFVREGRNLQQVLLEEEGVIVERYRVNMRHFAWKIEELNSM